MPLIKSASKKALSKNIETEMHANPSPEDRKRNIAIAFSVKREAGKKKKKMAEGGPVSAKSEARPMPETEGMDRHQIARNSAKKALSQSDWTGQPTLAQARKESKAAPIRHPKMVPTNAFSTRLYDKEGNLEGHIPPDEGHEDAWMNEEGADRQGPETHDLHLKKMAHGGMAKDKHVKGIHKQAEGEEAGVSEMGSDLNEPTMRKKAHAVLNEMVAMPKPKLKGLAEGGMADGQDRMLQQIDPPSEDEGQMMARHREELRALREGPAVPDMEHEHSTGRAPYAGGGEIGDDEENISHEEDLNPAHDKHSADDSEDQPMREEDEEHHDSIAAAIMFKRKKYADGGQVDLSRNADEDPNEEDQMSFQSLKKENYSETPGLEELGDQPEDSNLHGDEEESESENKHDMISSIRSKMKKHRQFPVK
jgi:hypothetical protein